MVHHDILRVPKNLMSLLYQTPRINSSDTQKIVPRIVYHYKNYLRKYVPAIAFPPDICYDVLYNDVKVTFMTFAGKVKFVRMKLYLNQAQLAKEIGVSFATVNRWESKGYEPQLASVGRFNDFCEKHGNFKKFPK